MLQSLQTRLSLSHLLPIIFLIILVAFGFLHVVRTDAFIAPRVQQMMADATMIGEVLLSEKYDWGDRPLANLLVNRLQPKIPADLALLNSRGELLASNLTPEEVAIQQASAAPIVVSALNGTAGWVSIDVSDSPWKITTDVAVAVPVFDTQTSASQPKVIGVVYTSQRADVFMRRLATLRWSALLYPIGAGILLAVALAFFLSRALALPLLRLADKMEGLDIAQPPQPINEAGPKEFRALAAHFNSMTQKLHDLSTARRQLISSIVHELGRPIGSIGLASQYLERYAADDPEISAQLLNDISDQAEHMRILLDDLVVLARGAEVKLTVDVQLVDIRPILDKQIELLTHKASAKQLKVVCTIQPDLPVVPVDPIRFTQIISNLLDNAYKYTPANGQISLSASIETRNQQSMFVVSVCDNGPGIELAEQAKVFQLFYRSPTQSRVQQGLGIGLSLSRQLAEAQGGTLELESRPGSGCKFTLSFPLDSSLVSSR